MSNSWLILTQQFTFNLPIGKKKVSLAATE
jgi:hypothetical protein